MLKQARFSVSTAWQAQVTGHLLDTDAFDEDFVTDYMNSLHAEHSFPPVAEILAQPYRTWGPECSFSTRQTVHYPNSTTIMTNHFFFTGPRLLRWG
jgi:hypothetical protein